MLQRRRRRRRRHPRSVAPPDVYAARFLAFVGGRVFVDDDEGSAGLGRGVAAAEPPALVAASAASVPRRQSASTQASDKPASAPVPAVTETKDLFAGAAKHALLFPQGLLSPRSWSLPARR